MTNINPAIPAPAATPGNGTQVVPPASVQTPAPATAAPGKPGVGTVTITTKEFADLQRAKARTLSFDRRAAIGRVKVQPTNDGSGTTPEDQRVSQAEAGRVQAEQRALAAEVRAGINEILSRDEFKNLPASTRALIQRNPAMLSDADNVEEALLDIEEYVRESVIGLDAPAPGTPPKGDEPAGHETPPAPGTPPAPTVGIELEDISKIPPQERSRAVLRNQIKKSRGIK